MQGTGRPGKSLSLWPCRPCSVQRQGDLAGPCISVALLVMLCTEAGRPGKSLYLCGVVGHAMYRGRERPRKSMLFCRVAGHAVYRRLAGKSFLFYGGRGHISTEAGRPGMSLLCCGVAGHVNTKVGRPGKSYLFCDVAGHINTEAGRPGKCLLCCGIAGHVNTEAGRLAGKSWMFCVLLVTLTQKQGDMTNP